MSHSVTIRRNKDGVVRTYKSDYEIGEHWMADYGDLAAYASAQYMYGEGNYSCDDNRAIFFNQAGTEPPTEAELEDEEHCGDSRYSILEIKNDQTGEVLYTEEDDIRHRAGTF